jgi:hypothetical protein
MVADAPLPPDVRPARFLEVVERGREELRAMVASGGRGGGAEGVLT